MISRASSKKWLPLLVFVLCLIYARDLPPQVLSPSWTGAKVPEGGFLSPGDSPAGLAWDGQYFWVADRAAQVIYQLAEDGTQVSELSLGSSAAVGPIAWDEELEGLWVVDQEDWSIQLVRIHGEPVAFALQLPATGLARTYPITGLTRDPESRALWLCEAAGHCSKLWRIENPAITVEERGESKGVRVEVSVFPSTDPRGLAWVPTTSGHGGCLWSIAYNAGKMPSREAVRAACEAEGRMDLNLLINKLMILEMVPWRKPSALTVKDGQLWAAFEADPKAGQPALVLPLRPQLEGCVCD